MTSTTLTRADLTEAVFQAVGLSRNESAQMVEDILEDFAAFFRSETKYRELGIPWRRGYLFEGAPGTGKSTLIQGISSHFEVPIYYVSLRPEMSASDLNNIFLSKSRDCLCRQRQQVNQ